MTAQSQDPGPDQDVQDRLRRKFDDALHELEAMAKSGPISERRVEELASDMSRAMMEAALLIRGAQMTSPPAKCPQCGGHEFRPVRGSSPPEEKKKSGG